MYKTSQHLLFLINIMIILQLKLPSKIRDWPPCQPSLPPFKPRIDCCCLVSSPTKAQAPALARSALLRSCMHAHACEPPDTAPPHIIKRLATAPCLLLTLSPDSTTSSHHHPSPSSYIPSCAASLLADAIHPHPKGLARSVLPAASLAHTHHIRLSSGEALVCLELRSPEPPLIQHVYHHRTT